METWDVSTTTTSSSKLLPDNDLSCSSSSSSRLTVICWWCSWLRCFSSTSRHASISSSVSWSCSSSSSSLVEESACFSGWFLLKSETFANDDVDNEFDPEVALFEEPFEEFLSGFCGAGAFLLKGFPPAVVSFEVVLVTDDDEGTWFSFSREASLEGTCWVGGRLLFVLLLEAIGGGGAFAFVLDDDERPAETLSLDSKFSCFVTSAEASCVSLLLQLRSNLGVSPPFTLAVSSLNIGNRSLNGITREEKKKIKSRTKISIDTDQEVKHGRHSSGKRIAKPSRKAFMRFVVKKRPLESHALIEIKSREFEGNLKRAHYKR